MYKKRKMKSIIRYAVSIKKKHSEVSNIILVLNKIYDYEECLTGLFWQFVSFSHIRISFPTFNL